MTERSGTAEVKVRNGSRTATLAVELMQMPPKRDMIIGLPHFRIFGFSVIGVPQVISQSTD